MFEVVMGGGPPQKEKKSHPLAPLDEREVEIVQKTVLESLDKHDVVKFRFIQLEEPPKAEVVPFLEAEHAGDLSSISQWPVRLGRAQLDVFSEGKAEYKEVVVDISSQKVVSKKVLEAHQQPALCAFEFLEIEAALAESELFKEACAAFELPEGYVFQLDPWPYGGPDEGEAIPRYLQGLVYARDARNGNPDSNHYGYPIPIVPVVDMSTKKVIRIDKLASGGTADGLKYDTHPKEIISHTKPAEYVPELLNSGLRTDLKALNVSQPDGPSFDITDGSVVSWQKWRFRVGFSPREGATIHDVRYDGRSIAYRLSFSEMTVPYGDPRPPYHRKQAFDFGDGGAGKAANNLELGCDCLGAIKYFDAVMVDQAGKPTVSKNVICLHEQDNGIGWKHTNYRTGRAVVTRSRELVVQFIITLANYEYIFAYKFDQAGGITIETRATGIVSVVSIDPGKTSSWGNIVSPGALAQNHQHIFCVRIDPAIDGQHNTVIQEESHPMPFSKDVNPFGNAYEVRQTIIEKSGFIDAAPQHNRFVKIVNRKKLNPISGKPVGYKFMPSPAQLLLAQPGSIMERRAKFAQHHVWVTKYKDGELWAGGEYTNQSQDEINGVSDAAKRGDSVADEDLVLWNVFGLTHNPRVEDWPVMPVEIHQTHFKPSDFFTANPALDVPSKKNPSSVLVNGSCCADDKPAQETGDTAASGSVQKTAETHWQGSTDIQPNGH